MFGVRDRIGIGGKITGLLLVLLVVAGVNVGTVYYIQQETNEITDTIKVANEQSVLSQEIAFHSFRKAEIESDGTQLQQAINQYDRNLAALENGTDSGEAVAGGLEIRSVPDEARNELQEQRRVWQAYSTHARTIATENPFNEEYTAAVEYVTEDKPGLGKQTQTIVDAYRNLDGNHTTEIDAARELQLHRSGMITAVLQHSQSFTSLTQIENELRSHRQAFDRVLTLLEDGGSYKGQTVEPAPAAVQDDIDSLREVWSPYRSSVTTIETTSRLNSDFWQSLRYVETNSQDLNNASASLATEMNTIIRDRQRFLQTMLGGLFVFNVIVALTGVVWVRRRVAQPLETVTEKADQIARQNIDVTIPETTRRDEIGRLFRSFEQMRSNIQHNIQDLRTAREDAENAKQAAEVARDDAERAREEAEQLNEQLQVLDRLLRHNLKNDMNVIKLHAEMTQKKIPDSKTEYVEKIVEKSDELLRKTDKQRQITHTLSTDSDCVRHDIAGVLRSLVDDLADNYPSASISLETPETATAMCMESVELAFRELIENAIMHNDTAEPIVDVTVSCDQTHTRIHVADNGPTLPETEQKVLQGTQDIDPLNHAGGMGLWLVFWTVNQSDGHLQYEPQNPRGNIITIELQRADNAMEATDEISH